MKPELEPDLKPELTPDLKSVLKPLSRADSESAQAMSASAVSSSANEDEAPLPDSSGADASDKLDSADPGMPTDRDQVNSPLTSTRCAFHYSACRQATTRTIQKYLSQKQHAPPRTLQYDYLHLGSYGGPRNEEGGLWARYPCTLSVV